MRGGPPLSVGESLPMAATGDGLNDRVRRQPRLWLGVEDAPEEVFGVVGDVELIDLFSDEVCMIREVGTCFLDR